MKNLFERLVDEGMPVINELVSSRTQEGVQLEFKTKTNSSNGELSRDDRGILGSTLSAFANSNGGLLLWGIEARKIDGVDAAHSAKAICDLSQFKSEVLRACGEILIPRHEGISVQAIEYERGSNTGFVAVWVERSERRPHRSEAAGDKRYYKRAGDSTYMMEHYDIEDAFSRVGIPALDVVPSPGVVGVQGSDGIRHAYEVSVDLVLQNNGSLSACAPYLRIDECGGCTVIAAPASMLNLRRNDRTVILSSDATSFVHPGFDTPACRLVFVLTYHWGTQAWHLNGDTRRRPRLTMSYSLGCQNVRRTPHRIEWGQDDLLRISGLSAPTT